MKTPDTERLPYAAALIGHAADAIGIPLREIAAEAGVSEPTVRSRRSGQGSKTASAIDAATLQLLLEDGSARPGGRTPEFWREVIRASARRWNRLVADLRTRGAPRTPAGLWYGVLRLVVIDAAIRTSAHRVRQAGAAEPKRNGRPPWLQRRAFGEMLETWRASTGQTREELAIECGVDVGTVRDWEHGTVPTLSNQRLVACILADGGDVDEVEHRIRLALLGAGITRALDRLLTPQLSELLLQRYDRVAGFALELLGGAGEALPDPLDELTMHGAHAQVPVMVPKLLRLLGARAYVAGHQSLALDLVTLGGPWEAHIWDWSDRSADEVRLAETETLTVSELTSFVASAEPEELASVVLPWARELAVHGNLTAAAQLAREAASLAPRSIEALGLLAEILGDFPCHGLGTQHVAEALDRVATALALATTDDDRRDLGLVRAVILSNAQRRAEAEAAFASVEPLARGYYPFHAQRGRNFGGLHRLEDAQRELSKAIDLAPDDREVRAMLARVCRARGRVREATQHERLLRQRGEDDAG